MARAVLENLVSQDPSTPTNMASINEVPAELLTSIAMHLASSSGGFWGDVNAFANTSRTNYLIINPYLYKLGAQFSFPLFWAAQNGRADTLHKLLQAGLETRGSEAWITVNEKFPSPLRVGRWIGRFHSVNAFSGAFDDDDQVEQVSPSRSPFKCSSNPLNSMS